MDGVTSCRQPHRRQHTSSKCTGPPAAKMKSQAVLPKASLCSGWLQSSAFTSIWPTFPASDDPLAAARMEPRVSVAKADDGAAQYEHAQQLRRMYVAPLSAGGDKFVS